MKDHILFDVTDANTRADTDNIGAWVRAGSDGDLIASQNVNSQDWLNVAALFYDETGTAYSDANPIPVSVKDGVNVEVDLDHTDDSVALGDGTSLLTSTTVASDIGLDVYLINSNIEVTQGTSPWVIGDGGGSITVDAVDLDIRALTTADEVTVYQGTSPWVIGDGGGSITVDGSVSITGDVNVTQGTSPWVVSATDLDIRDILHTQDSIRLGDGTNFIDSYANDLVVADIGNGTLIAASNPLGVANTAEDAVASPLANRKFLWLYNNDNRKMYIGGNGVTTAQGFPVSPGSYMELRAGAAVDVEFVAASAGHDLRHMELS